MNKKELLWLAVGIIAGIVFAPQVSKLPLINKIPSV